MKPNFKTTFESTIFDNRDFIEQNGGNISDYYHHDFSEEDQGHTWYLTDEEIEGWEADEARRIELINEITDFLEDYDFPVWEFLEQTSVDRIFDYIEYSKDHERYHEVSSSTSEKMIDEDGDLIFSEIQNFLNNNDIYKEALNMYQYEKFCCPQGEQQDDAEIIQNLSLNFSTSDIVLKCNLKDESFGQRQAIYFFIK